jgi:hypothetical protein
MCLTFNIKELLKPKIGFDVETVINPNLTERSIYLNEIPVIAIIPETSANRVLDELRGRIILGYTI